MVYITDPGVATGPAEHGTTRRRVGVWKSRGQARHLTLELSRVVMVYDLVAFGAPNSYRPLPSESRPA